jgi:hypothetical protein
MLRSLLGKRRGKRREGGQILVLFELCLIVMLLFVAMVIDLGFLRNNKQILVNTVDAAALAGGSMLPVTGATGKTSANALINYTIKADYPDLPPSAYTDGTIRITYKCLIGVDGTGKPRIADVPNACDPTNTIKAKPGGHTPPVASDFIGAGPTRSSDCDPSAYNSTTSKYDKCNVVVVEASSTTQYAFAPVGGVNSGSSGTVSSAACKGPCGASIVVPVDLVIILDRTMSMAFPSATDSFGNNKITSLQNAALAVLKVYDPAQQRVALGLTGPSKINATTGAPVTGSCNSQYGEADNPNKSTQTTLSAAVTTTGTTIKVNAAYSLPFPTSTGINFTILIDREQMTVKGGQGTSTWTVTRGVNGTQAAHTSGTTVYGVDPWTPSATTVGMWIPVGLSGTDTNSNLALPKPTGTAGTYEIGGTPNTASDIVKAINCISAATDATDLATPIKMAQWYLDHNGRSGVTQGIILETDGHPQYGFNSNGPCDSSGNNCLPQLGTNAAFTCQAAIDAATAAKTDKTNSPDGIQIFTIGYGVDSSTNCPTKTSTLSDGNDSHNMSESATWSNALATTFLQAMATDSAHYYENPSSSQLSAVFTQAAITLVHGGAHLVQLYPPPVVTSLSSTTGTHLGGNSITISGNYFTGATSVRFGVALAPYCTVTSDILITCSAVPGGTTGATVDVVVTTPGGISSLSSGDQYKYT